MLEPKIKKRKTKYNPEEEAKLERLIFGDSRDVIGKLVKDDPDAEENVDKIKVKQEQKEDVKLKLSSKSEPVDSDQDDSDLMLKYKSTVDRDECHDNNEENFDDSEDDEDEDDDDDDSDQDVKDWNKKSFRKEDKSVWFDEDDKRYSVEEAFDMRNKKLTRKQLVDTYDELLKNKFSHLVGTPNWAKLDKKKDDEDGYLSDSDYEMMKHSNHTAASITTKLTQGTIDMKRLKDINVKTHNEGPIITSLEFHPTSTVALVAGLSGILSIFQIDGRENTKLHSMQFEKFRIDKARFMNGGNQIILGSKRSNCCQLYDLMTDKTMKILMPDSVTNMRNFEISPNGKVISVVGKNGEIYLLSSGSKELIHTFKMNDKVRSLAFTPDSNHLISVGDTAEMYVWDLNNKTCVNRAVDEGCISASSIAISPNGQFLATGSKQGVANIYDLKSVINDKVPKPLKPILNLVTPITDLKFNPSSEILAMSSHLANNAFKLVHLPSYTVFSNFPTFQTVLNKPNAIDFSPGSGYLGISNNFNNAYLYRLKHYGNY